jgi:hypothetical protein
MAAPDLDGLWLDITGCRRFRYPGGAGSCLHPGTEWHSLPPGIAGTTGAAWALARRGKTRPFWRQDRAGRRERLADLPVASLGSTPPPYRIAPPGLRTVQIFCAFRVRRSPPASALPVLRLDQALGAMEEAIDWRVRRSTGMGAWLSSNRSARRRIWRALARRRPPVSSPGWAGRRRPALRRSVLSCQ